MSLLFLFRRIAVLMGVAALAACAGDKTVGSSPNVTSVVGDALPMPKSSDLVAASRPYLVGPFDKLRIEVFGVEDLQRDVQIDASGQLSFPLIGTVEAAGLTPNQLAALVDSRLRGRFVRDPQVTVNLVETISQTVTVDGQVNEPGIYPVVGRFTLMRAIATASGTSEYAKLDDVIIFRDVDGRTYAGLYNLGAIRRGNYEDPEVFANDIVIVGDSPQRRMFEDVLAASPLLTTPLIILFR
ncbi:polysaccharide biosynthesis/export family protein [Qipengyuania sp. DSG2-2]|uniref:polysaccharide biosynthesis/export family protein n=1 Tax=Qipengyuania sp. DGS2-2 TaxID=3349631 RepID=UPI0036D3743B